MGYCLLQQHGPSENLLHILSQYEKYVLVCSSPPNLHHVHFLLWELGKAQGHMALKDIQFTFCSRTQSLLIKLSLIGLVYFPLAIHYESLSLGLAARVSKEQRKV